MSNKNTIPDEEEDTIESLKNCTLEDDDGADKDYSVGSDDGDDKDFVFGKDEKAAKKSWETKNIKERLKH